MKLLLTGGTGFFGKALLRYFLSSPISLKSELFVLSRDPDKFLEHNSEFRSHKRVIFLKGDILIPSSLPWNYSFTHVLHAAADSTIGPTSTPFQRYDQIVAGTRNILDLASSIGVFRFLYCSSGAVYGPQPSDLPCIPEDWPLSSQFIAPSNIYGRAKSKAELLCQKYSTKFGFEIVLARCFSFIGPGLPLDAQFAVGNFIRDALISDVITVNSDGSSHRTYLDAFDLAHWLFAILHGGIAGEAYNVGSDVVKSIAELAFLVRDTLAPDKKVQILGQAYAQVQSSRYVPDILKARTQLDLNVTVPLVESIQRTAQASRPKSRFIT